MHGSFRVYPSLHDEAKEGWIWVSGDIGGSTEFVRVRNAQNRKCVVCERRTIDRNFRAYYNARENTMRLPESGRVVVLNDFFRQRLGGLKTQEDAQLEILDADGWWSRYVSAFVHHPHPAIRLGITLGLISVALGGIGLVLGVISLAK